MLYRLFPYLPDTSPREEGGPLFVPRAIQGRGRHDNPNTYGAVYASRSPAAVVAEYLRNLGPIARVGARDLLVEGSPRALATLEDEALPKLVDLDDPNNLVVRSLRPSRVATGDREITQAMARRLYEEGASGFEWWSTVEASWINVTLFADRAVELLSVVGDPQALTLDHPAVREAAEAVGVLLEP